LKLANLSSTSNLHLLAIAMKHHLDLILQCEQILTTEMLILDRITSDLHHPHPCLAKINLRREGLDTLILSNQKVIVPRCSFDDCGDAGFFRLEMEGGLFCDVGVVGTVGVDSLVAVHMGSEVEFHVVGQHQIEEVLEENLINRAFYVRGAADHGVVRGSYDCTVGL